MTKTFVFSRFAEKKFRKLEQDTQRRIREKLQELKEHDALSTVLKTLTDFSPATHRLRVGGHRLILQRLSDEEFLILDVGHRKEIYR